MSTIVVLVLIAVAAYFYMRKSGAKQTPQKASRRPAKTRESDDLGWLMEKWRQAEQEQRAGKLEGFPKWFFDEPTEHQMEKLASLDVNTAGRPTKGKASDLIGLFNPIDPADREVLKFFKASVKDMNQTKGRYEVRELLASPENRAMWDNRPATAEQREFFRFFGIKVAAGLSIKEAEKQIAETRAKVAQEDEGRLDEWDAYDSIVTDLTDDEMLRDEFEMKKPSLALIREAVAALVKAGSALTDLDADEVAEKIKEDKPEMARAG